MKRTKILTVLIAAMIMLSVVGCTTEETLKNIDGLYQGVRLIITDPDVKPQIPSKDLYRLADIEHQYLKAKEDIQSTGVENAKPLSVIVDCADEFLAVIDQFALDGKYKDEIKAIGVSLRILKKFIKKNGKGGGAYGND